MGGELGAQTAAAALVRFARAHLSGPQSINISDDLHLPYNCSTSSLTLNCLQIKKGEKYKKHLMVPVGVDLPTEEQRPHLCLTKRNTGLVIVCGSNTGCITWRAQEHAHLCTSASCMLAGLRHMWFYSKEFSWSSVLWAELSMSLLSRKELLILCLQSNFNSTFFYRH